MVLSLLIYLHLKKKKHKYVIYLFHCRKKLNIFQVVDFSQNFYRSVEVGRKKIEVAVTFNFHNLLLYCVVNFRLLFYYCFEIIDGNFLSCFRLSLSHHHSHNVLSFCVSNYFCIPVTVSNKIG